MGEYPIIDELGLCPKIEIEITVVMLVSTNKSRLEPYPRFYRLPINDFDAYVVCTVIFCTKLDFLIINMH